MRRGERLRRRREFAAVYRQGHRHRGRLLVVRALANGRPTTRLGFTVGKALGTAVTRNRVKRRLREAARSLGLENGWDIVVNARQGAQSASYHELRTELAELVGKARIARRESSR